MSNDNYRYYRSKKGDPLAVYIEDEGKETVLAFFGGNDESIVLDKCQWKKEQLWGVQAVARAEAELVFSVFELPGRAEKTFPSVEKIGMLMNGSGRE